jgi:N-formylglutamate deformylase
MAAPFERIDAVGPAIPVIVEVPHARLHVDGPFFETLAAPCRALARDADLYVDALYELAPAAGATMLVARFSRYVIDVNRAEGDIDADVVEGARTDLKLEHGLIWRTTGAGEPALTRKLTAAELRERIDLIWRPYHDELTGLIARARSEFGVVVVVAAHSMPSVGPPPAALPAAPQRPRADVVPGTRGRKSAAPKFIEAVEAHAIEAGWTVAHDDPYAGGFTTQHYGRPQDGVHVVQVELARRLYLNEGTLRPLPTFDLVRSWCSGLVTRLGRIATSS